MDARYMPGLIDGTIAIIGFDPNYPDRTLDLIPVSSSRFCAYGYAPEQMIAYIAFKAGTVYEYQGVEPDVWDAWQEADSKGSFAIANVIGKPRNPIYPFRKVEAAAESDDPASGGQEAAKPRGEILRPAQAGSGDSIPDLPERDEELKDRALAVQLAARQLAITTPERYSFAGDRLTSIKAERKIVEARLNRVYDPAYKAYKEALALKQESLAPYDEAEKILKKSMLEYHRIEEDQRRRAEQEERMQREAQAREDAKKESEAAAKRDAEYARAQGEEALAQSIERAPLPIAPKPVAPVVHEKAVPEVKGVSRRENWQYRIVDAAQIPLTHEFYTLDEKKIAQKAKLLKSHANIPGVEVYDEGTIAAR
jgi:hypothetical protein